MTTQQRNTMDKIAEHMALALRWFTTGLATDHAALEASARALAQGEPGEAVAEVCSGWDIRWVGSEPIATLLARNPGVRIGTKLYLSPTASAPAAEREPPAWPITWEVSWGELDEDDECSPCGWRVHDRRGGRNDREWTLIATGSSPFEAIRAAHGIGTKEPTNG